MARKYDLVVIGTGSAASTVASTCRADGWTVAVIDSRPFGGTCALRGCDPKKVLVGAAEVLDWNRRMKGKGIVAEQARIDWPALMRFKRTFTDPVPRYREEAFTRAGIESFHGRARFNGPTTVEVGSEQLEGRYVVIAAGARPASLQIPGESLLTYSDGFLELDSLPERIVFVGGGYISFEFAHIAARAGSHATILHRGARPLAGFDPDLVDLLLQHTRELGIDVQLGAKVESLSGGPGRLVVNASIAGKARSFEAEMVIHGAGRVAEIDDMNLAAAGVDWEPRGVKVNEYLQSVSNPRVYAAGDAAASGGMPLTPVAGHEGGIVAANLLKGNHQKPNHLGVPTVTFTVPPLAAVGLQERAARERGLKFRTHHESTSNWYSSRRIGETCSAFKVLIEEGSERILGAHLLGPHSEDTINIFALAVRNNLGAPALRDMIFAYPTNASDIQYML